MQNDDFLALVQKAVGHVPVPAQVCAEYVVNRRGILPDDDPLAIFWAANASELASFTVHSLDAARTSLVAQARQLLKVLRKLEAKYA